MTASRPILVCADTGTDHVLATVIASLPDTLALAANGQPPQARAISGGGDWCAAVLAALAHGTRGIVLDRPRPAPTTAIAQVRAAAQAQGATVVVRGQWSSHAAVAQLRSAASADEAPVLIDCLTTGRSARPHALALFDQLHFVTTLVGPVEHVVTESAMPNATIARGRLAGAGAQIAFTAVETPGQLTCDLRIHSLDRMRRIVLPDSSEWDPALAVVATREGELSLPAHYESADRAAWLRLAGLIDSAGGNTDDLATLAQIANHIEAT